MNNTPNKIQEFIKSAKEIQSELLNVISSKNNEIENLRTELQIKQASLVKSASESKPQVLPSNELVDDVLNKMVETNIISSEDVEFNKKAFFKDATTSFNVLNTVLSKFAKQLNLEQGKGYNSTKSVSEASSKSKSVSNYMDELRAEEQRLADTYLNT